MLKFRKNNMKVLLVLLLFILSSLISINIRASSIKSVISKSNNIETQKLSTTYNVNDSFPEMISKVDGLKLQEYIQKIQDFGPHPTGSAAINDVGEYLYNELTSMNLIVEYDNWNYKKKSGRNIVATHSGIGKKDSIVIVCAHYDTVEISPGADDAASGIACVLMIADIMSDYSFNSTVKFILFSGEEGGCFGSHEYSRRAYENGDNIIGVLAIDKVGYAESTEDGNFLRHHASSESEWMIDISQNISNNYFDLIELIVLKFPYDLSSDHRSFIEYGFKGSNFVENTLNPTYHTSEDTIEFINISYLTKVCKLSLCTISKIASLNPLLADKDLDIKIKGTLLSTLSQLEINVSNSKYLEDTTNVTIKIEMKHLLRKIFVSTLKKYYITPCSWNFTKEIDKYWTFKITSREFTRGLFILEVTIKGLNDDINLYKKQYTYGFINNPYKIRLIPIF